MTNFCLNNHNNCRYFPLFSPFSLVLTPRTLTPELGGLTQPDRIFIYFYFFADDNEEAESSQEEISDDIDISETEENSRSKRLGVFGNLFGGAAGGSNGGSSGGGSGNFLFDIIRVSVQRGGIFEPAAGQGRAGEASEQKSVSQKETPLAVGRGTEAIAISVM